MGGRGYGGGGRRRLYTYRYTVTTRMTCIKMGSGESHFNVSLIVREKVTRQCPQTTKFLMRKESRSGIVPRSFRLPAYRLTARPNRLSSFLESKLRYKVDEKPKRYDVWMDAASCKTASIVTNTAPNPFSLFSYQESASWL